MSRPQRGQRQVQSQLGRLEHECRMCVALAEMVKKFHDSLWSHFPVDDRTGQFCFLVDWSTDQLAIYGERESPVEGADQALDKGLEVLHAIAAGVKRKKWSELHERLLVEGDAALGTSLRSSDCEISNYVIESLERAEQLFDDFVRTGPCSRRAVTDYEPAKKVRVEVKDGHPAAAYARNDRRLLVRYLKRRDLTDCNLMRLVALPLYFFHEVFSHVAPRRDLHLNCADGWMMEAAFQSWWFMSPTDNLIGVERHALLKEIARHSGSDGLLKFHESPFAQVANLFAARYPQTFWELTFDLLQVSGRVPTEEMAMGLLRDFLRDPPKNSPLWIRGLDRILKSNGKEDGWPGLDRFCEQLLEVHQEISSTLGLRTLS